MQRRSFLVSGSGQDWASSRVVIPSVYNLPSIVENLPLNPPLLPSSIDTFRTIIKASDVLANYQDNIRSNTQFIQSAYYGLIPGSVLTGDLALTQQALRDFGNAVITALNPLRDAFLMYPTQIAAAAVAPLPLLSDLATHHALLRTWGVNLQNTILNSSADLDNGVAALLAAIPPRVLPY